MSEFGPFFTAEKAASIEASGTTPHTCSAFKAGEFIFVAGQGPSVIDPNPNDETFAEQVHQCCQKIRDILKAAESDISRVVKVTVLVDKISRTAVLNPIYKIYFPHTPARICYAVKEMANGIPVEIECMAYAGEVKSF